MSLPTIICNTEQVTTVLHELWNTLKYRTLKITSIAREGQKSYVATGEWQSADFAGGELWLVIKFKHGQIQRFHESQVASIEVV